LQSVQELEVLSIDVSTNNILHNLVTKDTQFMKGSLSWRGSKEKDPLFMQMLIESTTFIKDMVLYYTTSIGMASFIIILF
jgi:hypothetical protein